MRITSIILRNCRLHREQKVDFDPARTLIGGPNETGKSTLIEAMHRALFLKAKGNTEHHRAMVSSLYPGHPEVELAFEAGGNTYLLKKRFGTLGTITLAPSDAVMLSGDAAESELARILVVEAGVTGKAIAVQWAHLWVWQGQAGEDPSAHVTAQQNGLLQRLQQIGGAAALQSELDARVAKHFCETRDQIYTQADKPKTGSELERAERASALAEEELLVANERVRKLDSVAVELESASRALLESSASLVDLEKRREEMEAKGRQLVELRQQETERSHAAKEAVARHGVLESANQQILKARADIFELERSLKPQNEVIVGLEKAVHGAKDGTATAEGEYRAASEAVRAARIRHDLVLAHTLLFEKTEIHTKLSEKDQKVSKRRRDLSELEKQFAKLPKVDKPKLNKLQKLETECSNARAALQAMATGLEVVAADKPVKAGGQSIKVGQQQILTEDTELQIGSAIRLRIRPGGGNSLVDARRTEVEAQRDLRAVLDSLGLPSLKEAIDVQARRDELGSGIKAAQAELEGMGVDNLADELNNAQNDLAAARASVDRLAVLAPDLAIPTDKPSVKALAKALEGKLGDAEDREARAKVTLDRVAKALRLHEDALQARRMEAEQQSLKLNGLNAQLDLLLRTHGDDAARSLVLVDCQSAKNAAQGLLKTTADAIAALQPDLLEGDRARIARALKERTGEQGDARTRIGIAQAALISDGSEDPMDELATAEAKARIAGEHRNSVQRRAQAVVLLDRLFQEEQRGLTEQFTQPLADKISAYLQCIFGAGARAQVDFDNNEFTGLRLSRPGFGSAPFAFHALSGGAREQTAAAVRLAMAEVLAEGHDGCLPIVFDDAFAYSDPDRVQTLQRMLDLAATRGLQVIVLTCNPSDYAALGARQVSLRAEPAPFSVTEAPATILEETDSPRDATEEASTDPAVTVEVSEAQRQALLAVLPPHGESKGNIALRRSLGWDESTYQAVKKDLLAKGRVIAGVGRGGSLALVCSSSP